MSRRTPATLTAVAAASLAAQVAFTPVEKPLTPLEIEYLLTAQPAYRIAAIAAGQRAEDSTGARQEVWEAVEHHTSRIDARLAAHLDDPEVQRWIGENAPWEPRLSPEFLAEIERVTALQPDDPRLGEARERLVLAALRLAWEAAGNCNVGANGVGPTVRNLCFKEQYTELPLHYTRLARVSGLSVPPLDAGVRAESTAPAAAPGEGRNGSSVTVALGRNGDLQVTGNWSSR